MCRSRCAQKCAFAFAGGLILSSFTEGGAILFFAGIAVIILTLCLKNCC